MILRDGLVLGGAAQDLGIRDGLLCAPEDLRGALGIREVDCSGLVVLPGLVDLHTHLREPGNSAAETFPTGTRSAAAGGYTAVCAMANTDPAADNVAAVEAVRDRAAQVGWCDVFPVGAVTVGLGGTQLTDIAGMASSRARVRVFSDDGVCVSSSAVMRRALEAVRDVDGVLAQHAQDPQLTVGAQLHDGSVARELGMPGWPAVAEEVIIARDCLLAHHLGARLHLCHVSTAGSVEVIRWAKSRGWPVTAEVTPHHLLLTHELARTGDPAFKVNPPLREDHDVQALRRGLADGTIDAVATDHAPHTPDSKAMRWCEAPMGMLGLETAVAVVAETMVATGLLTWAEIADRMSVRPARIAGVVGEHGGRLDAGTPATLCLVDPAHGWTVDGAAMFSNSQNTPFEQMRFSTRVVGTVLRGEVTHALLAGLA